LAGDWDFTDVCNVNEARDAIDSLVNIHDDKAVRVDSKG
jgi:hypothetical protein